MRISFGYLSTFADLEAFLQFVHRYFVEQTPPVALTATVVANLDVQKAEERVTTSTISHFIIYPVKSCGGINVDRWDLSETGPMYDREWTIVDERGHALQQKRVPRMASIVPRLDLQARVLELSSRLHDKSISIDLDYYPDEQLRERDMNVCGNKLRGLVYEEEYIGSWLTQVLGLRCRLVRKNPSRDRFAKSIKRTVNKDNARISYQRVVSADKLNFTNEAQFLVVTRASLDAINDAIRDRYWIGSDGYDFSHEQYRSSDWLIERFRPNIVLEDDAQQAWEEDRYRRITICSRDYTVVLRLQGPCNRCSMICVDSRTYDKVDEPLKTLLDMRRDGGRALFGILMSVDSASSPSNVENANPSIDRNSVVRVHVTKSHHCDM